jgi:chloramphenicol 3-O phosphotransferase
MAVQTGKIILIHGPSSSGKSAIAGELQARIEAPFWHISIDHMRDAGILPMARIRSREFPWTGLRGPFFDGFHHALAAYAGSGNNLIVEHIVETQEWMGDLVRLLTGFDVFSVRIHCDVEEMERREIARGDRRAGDARRDFETLPVFTHDLELDSTATKAGENVDRLLSAWRARRRPSAFERMAQDSSVGG